MARLRKTVPFYSQLHLGVIFLSLSLLLPVASVLRGRCIFSKIVSLTCEYLHYSFAVKFVNITLIRFCTNSKIIKKKTERPTSITWIKLGNNIRFLKKDPKENSRTESCKIKINWSLPQFLRSPPRQRWALLKGSVSISSECSLWSWSFGVWILALLLISYTYSRALYSLSSPFFSSIK